MWEIVSNFVAFLENLNFTDNFGNMFGDNFEDSFRDNFKVDFGDNFKVKFGAVLGTILRLIYEAISRSIFGSVLI